MSSAIRTRKFALSYAGVLLGSIPLFSVFVNLVPYAEDHGISKVTAATLLSIIGASSIVGRIGLSWLATRLSTALVYVSSFGAMALSQLVWLGAGSNYALLALFCMIFGASYGGFIALSPALLAEIFGAEQLGGLAGINYSAAGFGALVGPAAGAWLVDATGSYTLSISLGCAFGIGATTALLALTRSLVTSRG